MFLHQKLYHHMSRDLFTVNKTILLLEFKEEYIEDCSLLSFLFLTGHIIGTLHHMNALRTNFLQHAPLSILKTTSVLSSC